MMTGAALFWIAVFGCASLLFFATAAVITVVGLRDLRDLLSGPTQRKDPSQTTGGE